jgi:hypothetical protein
VRPSGANSPGLRKKSPLPGALIALVVLGIAVALALDAMGVIFARTGAGVEGPETAPRTGTLSARTSRLLALRAPDPAGGPPWGMRIVDTTAGLLCVQVGRVEQGQLGQLGVDGAFAGDRRFHLLELNDLPEMREGGVSETSDCIAPGRTFAGEIAGLDRNAVTATPGGAPPSRFAREVSFGLLGPNARSITYRSEDHTQTRPVSPPLGAYLLIQRATGTPHNGISATYGSSQPHDLYPAGPLGALTSTTYRYGHTVCTDNGTGSMHRLCRLPE